MKRGCSSAYPEEHRQRLQKQTSDISLWKKTATCGSCSVCFRAPLASEVKPSDAKAHRKASIRKPHPSHPPRTHTVEGCNPPPLQCNQPASAPEGGLTCLWMQTLHHVAEKVVQLSALDVAIVCRLTEHTIHLNFQSFYSESALSRWQTLQTMIMFILLF